MRGNASYRAALLREERTEERPEGRSRAGQAKWGKPTGARDRAPIGLRPIGLIRAYTLVVGQAVLISHGPVRPTHYAGTLAAMQRTGLLEAYDFSHRAQAQEL
jgi:hypothetical protein